MKIRTPIHPLYVVTSRDYWRWPLVAVVIAALAAALQLWEMVR